jgi:hypothetical protein
LKLWLPISPERLLSFGSDHFPIYIKLSYEPEAKAQRQQPAVGREEREEAAEKIGKEQRGQCNSRPMGGRLTALVKTLADPWSLKPMRRLMTDTVILGKCAMNSRAA